MAEAEGWVKVHRCFLDWEWSDNPVMVTVFMHLLLLANFTDSKWRGQDVKRGQVVASIDTLSKRCGVTSKQLRTAIAKLKTTGEVASEGHTQYTVFTILNYEKYQDRANEGQTEGKRRANGGQHYKNDKNDKNDNNSSANASESAKDDWEIVTADGEEIDTSRYANWRKDFTTYKKYCNLYHYLFCQEEKEAMQERYPYMDFDASIKLILDYWMSEEGYQVCKSGKAKKLQWKSRIARSFNMTSNRVNIPREWSK